MASSNKSPNKLLLLLAPIVVIGGIWGIKSIASSSQLPAGETQAAAGIDGKRMVDLQKPLKEGIEALESGNLDRAKREYAEWKETWQSVEASFKQQSPDAYEKMEQGMTQVDRTLVNEATPDKEGAIAAFKSLKDTITAAK